jgi:hypothetical protein
MRRVCPYHASRQNPEPLKGMDHPGRQRSTEAATPGLTDAARSQTLIQRDTLQPMSVR